MNKTIVKNYVRFILIFITSALTPSILFCLGIIDITKIRSYTEEFHYNLISTSAIIGGFLFTGISILISIIDKPRIKRLWDNHYLDNLYWYGFGGMIANVITIISALSILLIDLHTDALLSLLYIEIISLIFGIVFFLCCLRCLIFIIKRING